MIDALRSHIMVLPNLVKFAICVSTYTTSFSLVGLSVQVIEIAVFV